jgi:hypothetical protein
MKQGQPKKSPEASDPRIMLPELFVFTGYSGDAAQAYAVIYQDSPHLLHRDFLRAGFVSLFPFCHPDP